MDNCSMSLGLNYRPNNLDNRCEGKDLAKFIYYRCSNMEGSMRDTRKEASDVLAWAFKLVALAINEQPFTGSIPQENWAININPKFDISNSE